MIFCTVSSYWPKIFAWRKKSCDQNFQWYSAQTRRLWIQLQCWNNNKNFTPSDFRGKSIFPHPLCLILICFNKRENDMVDLNFFKKRSAKNIQANFTPPPHTHISKKTYCIKMAKVFLIRRKTRISILFFFSEWETVLKAHGTESDADLWQRLRFSWRKWFRRIYHLYMLFQLKWNFRILPWWKLTKIVL